MSANPTRTVFVVLWCVLLAAKLWLAAALQPFGDEAFYAQESRHLAWAYSDLPGATAWLIRAGNEIAGPGVLAMRLPFLVLGAMLPWLVVRIAGRWFGAATGWQAGTLALMLPLTFLLGVLALPDVPMAFAALLCLDAVARLLRGGGAGAAVQLALALAIGACTHYRFAAVIVAGAAGLLCSAQGRALLLRPRVLAALAVGAAAWWPLLVWNTDHGNAGIAFQLVDRHPWQLQWLGLWWLPTQLLVVTPLLFVLLLATLAAAWRRRRDDEPAWALLLGIGGVGVGAYFLLGFVADNDRINLHWPQPGWMALCCAAPLLLARWSRGLRVALYALAAAGIGAWFVWFALLAQPAGRAWLAGTPAYADTFTGWDEIAAAVRERTARMPAGTRLVTDNFMLGAQLSLALRRDDIRVLPHPRNDRHGRRAQLEVWGLLDASRAWTPAPTLLVVEDTSRQLRHRLDAYRDLCSRSGALAAPDIVSVDHGRKRYLLWTLPAGVQGCRLPALAYIDAPVAGPVGGDTLEVDGWALLPEGRLRRVEVTLDGQVVAVADYGRARPDVVDYWGLDGNDPGVGFHARVDLRGRDGGAWLGLRLHAADGRVEDWPGPRLRIAGAAAAD